MCLLLLAMVPAWAADLPQEVTDAAPPAAEELEGKDFSGGIAALLEQGTTLLGEALRGNLRGAVLILGVVLLCGAADAVLRTPESPMRRFLPMAGAAAIAVLSLGSMKSLLGLGTQTIEELDVFSKALLPTLAAAVAAGGGAVTAGTGQVIAVCFADVFFFHDIVLHKAENFLPIAVGQKKVLEAVQVGRVEVAQALILVACLPCCLLLAKIGVKQSFINNKPRGNDQEVFGIGAAYHIFMFSIEVLPNKQRVHDPCLASARCHFQAIFGVLIFCPLNMGKPHFGEQVLIHGVVSVKHTLGVQHLMHINGIENGLFLPGVKIYVPGVREGGGKPITQ